MQDCCRIILESITVTLDDGTTAEVSVIWSENGYDSSKAGEYVLTGTLTIDETITNSQGLAAHVTVTVKEKPENPGGGDEQDPDGAGQKPDESGNNSSNGKNTADKAVDTGDSTSVAIWNLEMLLALAVAITMGITMRKKFR